MPVIYGPFIFPSQIWIDIAYIPIIEFVAKNLKV